MRAEPARQPGVRATRSRTLLISVGRVDREKRLDILIQALVHLGRPDLQLAIAGEGAAAGELHTPVDGLGLRERVRFLGRLRKEELPALLSSADMSALAGEAELLSIASLQRATAHSLDTTMERYATLYVQVQEGEGAPAFQVKQRPHRENRGAAIADRNGHP